MPRTEKVIVVFVASPSDLENERHRLEEVIRELNVTWSKTLGVRLDLVRWETHAFPGIGSDPQDLINRQIGDDYDIFLGMMWGRFGTQTGRAGSGTEDEFIRAKRRFQTNSNAVRIMFYFKDAPISPSKIDPSQLQKVLDFKASLGEEGVLYWSFTGLDDFEGLVRMHLARQIQGFQSEAALSPAPQDLVPAAITEESGEELGILDLMDVFEERLSTATEITQRIGLATQELGEKMRERTAEINEAARVAGGQLSRADAIKLTNKVADEMNQFRTRASAELPIFRSALREGIHALGKAGTLAVDLNTGDLSQVKAARTAVSTLEAALTSGYDPMLKFQQTVHALPRMTTEVNKARRGTIEALDELLRSLDEGRRDAQEAGKLIDVLLNREQRAD